MPTESSPPSAASVQDRKRDGQEQHGGPAEKPRSLRGKETANPRREMAGGSGGILTEPKRGFPSTEGSRGGRRNSVNGDRSEDFVLRRRSDPRREGRARSYLLPPRFSRTAWTETRSDAKVVVLLAVVVSCSGRRVSKSRIVPSETYGATKMEIHLACDDAFRDG
ncbi:hypothetical protein NL676_026363 [Syzygium grande]|nr:hypothetical protein NL676_026363 [Syzygium grande]